MTAPPGTIAAARQALASGATTASRLVDACLERAEDPRGEGGRAFIEVDAAGARAAAHGYDEMRAAGSEPTPYAGIPVSIKDLFDVRRQVTRAGSRVLDEGPAPGDAAAVSAWRRAGLVLVGRTNMTEFAFSGLGINPHYGTPTNPWDRERGRIPGGSSSGAAVSVADGMAFAALGSDTGGSCRIPAALCGLVGLKPTQARIPRFGMVPLSPTLDAVGIIARSVDCCAELESVARDAHPEPPAEATRPPRLAVPANYVFEGVDDEVSGAFARTVETLRAAGAEIVELDVPEFDEIPTVSAAGGFPAAESYAWHRELIDAHADGYDPRVLSRIRRGEAQPASDLVTLGTWRQSFITRVRARLDGFDGFACPTVPVVAPPLDVLADDGEYGRLNLLCLRNPTIVNLLDGCAISLPMEVGGEAPSGFMLSCFGREDERLLKMAKWTEARI